MPLDLNLYYRNIFKFQTAKRSSETSAIDDVKKLAVYNIIRDKNAHTIEEISNYNDYFFKKYTLLPEQTE